MHSPHLWAGHLHLALWHVDLLNVDRLRLLPLPLTLLPLPLPLLLLLLLLPLQLLPLLQQLLLPLLLQPLQPPLHLLLQLALQHRKLLLPQLLPLRSQQLLQHLQLVRQEVHRGQRRGWGHSSSCCRTLPPLTPWGHWQYHRLRLLWRACGRWQHAQQHSTPPSCLSGSSSGVCMGMGAEVPGGLCGLGLHGLQQQLLLLLAGRDEAGEGHRGPHSPCWPPCWPLSPCCGF